GMATLIAKAATVSNRSSDRPRNLGIDGDPSQRSIGIGNFNDVRALYYCYRDSCQAIFASLKKLRYRYLYRDLESLVVTRCVQPLPGTPEGLTLDYSHSTGHAAAQRWRGLIRC